jgi:hypothetical protein
MSTLTLEVTPEMAAWYEQASEAEKREVSELFEAIVIQLADSKPEPLISVMNRIARNAKERGLTEEILAEILADE